MDIDAVLAEAYRLDQIAANRPAAIAYLIAAGAGDEVLLAALGARREQLGVVRAARSMGGQCGCHVTSVTFDLLDRALG